MLNCISILDQQKGLLPDSPSTPDDYDDEVVQTSASENKDVNNGTDLEGKI